MKKHYCNFLITPSGPASGSRRCCYMESCGPRIHSFEALNLNFEYFVQYTSPLKGYYKHCLISPSGPSSASRRCCYMELLSFEAFNVKSGTTRNPYEKILIFFALIGSKRRFKWDLRPWKSSYCCYKA